MIQQNKIQGQSEKNDYKDKRLIEIEYSISIIPQLRQFLKMFCDKIGRSENDVINILLKMDLEEIESHFRSKNHEFILRYNDTSDIMGQKKNSIDKSVNREIYQTFLIKINIVLDNAIKETCSFIKIVKPKDFIENGIKYQFNAILDNIKNGDYQFLGLFWDFSEITDQLKKLKKN